MNLSKIALAGLLAALACTSYAQNVVDWNGVPVKLEIPSRSGCHIDVTALRKDSGETPIRLTVTNRNNFSTMFKIRISARPLNGGGDGL